MILRRYVLKSELTFRIQASQPPAKSTLQHHGLYRIEASRANRAFYIPSLPTGMPLAPPPFDGRVFATLEEYVAAVQAHAKSEGYAVITNRISNKRNDEYHRCDLACDRGKNKMIVRSTGIRPSARSIKAECPFRAKVVERAIAGYLWVYETINPSYNHEPTHEPTAHAMHRRRYDEAITTISRL